ncbi:MAG: GNAT family N-acetyltransferase [Thermoguttaceae bacterium]
MTHHYSATWKTSPPISPPEVIRVTRYQMVCDLKGDSLPVVDMPAGFRPLRWSPRLRDLHARVQYLGFRDEDDANLFPSFQSNERCIRLIDSLASSSHFDPAATLLVVKRSGSASTNAPQWRAVATIQVMRYTSDMASIVNITVLPEFRRSGIGAALLSASLRQLAGDAVRSVALEVTATNSAALHLYTQFGFRIDATIYKEVAVV